MCIILRCNGEYQLTVSEKRPTGVRSGDHSSKYGSLLGMNGDQIMYVSQSASEYFFIVDQRGENVCSAKILPENMHNHYDQLLIEFKSDEARKLEARFELANMVTCRAKFEVKHLYFNLLRKSLRRLSNNQICKIMPDPAYSDHGLLRVLPRSTCKFIDLDADSQQPALQKIVSSGSQVPVLISGAFGTGKTRLLAVATYHFIEEGKQKKIPTRVLIACHHQNTADTFIEEYFGKMVQNKVNPWRVRIARITRHNYYTRSNYQHMYKNLKKFNEMYSWEFAQENYVVIVTTLLTGFDLKYTVGDKFFTHILLDEAAQAREPEAVAPLCMANQDTKIVIAGDDRQVNHLSKSPCMLHYISLI